MARSEDEVVDWLDCVSAIETDQGVIYFCDQEYFNQKEFNSESQNVNTQIENSDHDIRKHCSRENYEFEKRVSLRPIGDFPSYFPTGHFLYSLTGYNPMNMEQDIVDNLSCNDRLLSELKHFFPDCKILTNFSYFPKRPYHFEKGFTVMIPVDYPLNHQEIIHNLALKYCQAAYFKCRILADYNEQILVVLENGPVEVKEELVVVERLSYHPAFLHHQNNSLFHNLRDALHIISKCHIPEADYLLQLAQQHQINMERNLHKPSQSAPIIAVEGLDNIGIGKLSRKLSKTIKATHLESPPSCLQSLRKIFDDQNQMIKGAFYTIGNYILAAQILEEIRKNPVVLDRYWNSTAAFIISKEVGCGASNLPPKGHFVYHWPEDLPRPTTTVLVGSKKDIRGGQISNKTQRNSRQIIYTTFQRMKDKSWIEVDKAKQKCSTKDALAQTILHKLFDKKIINFDNNGPNQPSLCPGLKDQEPVIHDRFVEDGKAESFSSKLERLNLSEWGSETPALILH